MGKVWPWVRTVVGFVLGLVAIELANRAGAAIFPEVYAALDTDAGRVTALAVATLAGIAGSFVLGAIARHRLGLHMALFGIAMLAIDLAALRGPLSTQPLWFKVAVIATLPLQVWIGGWLAGLTWRRTRDDPKVIRHL